MRYLLAALLAFTASPALAWTDGGAPLNLHVPSAFDSGSTVAEALRYNFAKLSTASVVNSSTSWPSVGRITVTTFTAVNSTGFYFSSGPINSVGKLTAPDATLTYGLTAATGSFSGSVTVGSMSITGGGSEIYSFKATNGAANSERGTQAKFGADAYLSNYGGATYLTALSELSNGGVWTARGTTAAGIGVNDTNGIVFNINSGLVSGNAFSPTARATLNSTGFGIGTASPCSTCTLHVAGGASVTGAFQVGASVGSAFNVRAADGVAYFGPTPNTSDVTLGGAVFGAANLFIKGDSASHNGHAIIFGSSAGGRLATVSSRWLTGDRIHELGNGSASFVGVASTGGMGVYSRTKAQLLAITPIIGDLYYCSDCADATSGKPTVVIATGTSAGNFGTLPIGVFQ